MAKAGFTKDNPEALRSAIQAIAGAGEVTEDRSNEYGVFYQVIGELVGANDVNLSVVTIWLQRQHRWKVSVRNPQTSQKDFNMSLELYREVALTRDLPECELRAGDIATLIDFVSHPNGGEEGSVLEVFSAVGGSLAVIAVPLSTVEILRPDEILTVRSLAKAS